MFGSHKIVEFVCKLLLVKPMHLMKLLHGNLFTVVQYTLVNYSRPTTANYALLRKMICNMV